MRRCVILTVLSLISGCAPLETYYRAGATVEALKSDGLACEVQALKDAPVANQTRITPPRYIPARRVCDSAGTCTTRGGFWLDGDVYTVDANADLRQRIERQCMARRGYSPAEIPQCPPDVARKAPPGVTRVLPPLSEASCVIRNEDGTIQIVTRR